MFCATMWGLTTGRSRSDVHKPMFIIAILLLLLSTAVSIDRMTRETDSGN